MPSPTNLRSVPGLGSNDAMTTQMPQSFDPEAQASVRHGMPYPHALPAAHACGLRLNDFGCGRRPRQVRSDRPSVPSGDQLAISAVAELFEEVGVDVLCQKLNVSISEGEVCSTLVPAAKPAYLIGV